MRAGTELHHSTILQSGSKLGGICRGYGRARLGSEEQLRIHGSAQRVECPAEYRSDIGGLAGDRQLVGESPEREPRALRGKRSTVGSHLLIGQLSDGRAPEAFDKDIVAHDQLLADARSPEPLKQLA